MGIDELFGQFHEIASSPRKQLDKYLAAGKKVVACAPIYTPEEIIHSMGLVPMGVWGAEELEVHEAKKYYPAFICSVMQTTLELGITGKYKGVSAIVIPSLCDSLKSLGENWKYAVKDIPFIPMTYPQNRKPAYGVKFTKAGYERVIENLEVATGARFSGFALANSNRVYNEHNAVMREFAEVAAEHTITAAQRHDVFKSAWFMLKEEHTALVKQLIAELKKTPEEKNKMRVVVSGIMADSLSLLGIFDRNGLKIVADDLAQESRQYRTDVPENADSLEALAQKFAAMDNCCVLYDKDKKRVNYIVDLAKKQNAAGVIVLMTKFCDPEEFDYVPIKRACEAAHIKNLNIEVDQQMVNYEQAGTMIQAFREMS